MEGIYQMNQPFDFTKLSLLSPIVTAGGNYFIKFRVNDNPLYIQPPKCKTKQGIYKSGKKYFCDLVFTNDHESFIHWMDNLESQCRKVIYENKLKWFETDLDENDIENSFTSPLKWVKTGKYYICRVHIPTSLGNCALKIYNENEEEISIDSIQENQNVMTILEIQGIKCSAKSFQIDIEIKQMLVMKPDNLFDKCIFKPLKSNVASSGVASVMQEESKYLVVEKKQPEPEPEEMSLANTISRERFEHTSIIESPQIIEEPKDTMVSEMQQQMVEESKMIEISNIEPEDPYSNDIQEVQFDVETLPANDVIQIKKRNDVYYEMYKEAKKKAKIARDLAISSYLEAKQIKQTYLLRDREDSDSDSGLEDDFFNIKEQ